jgi:aminoglycoside phosphotransferase (APT) family kinase protein
LRTFVAALSADRPDLAGELQRWGQVVEQSFARFEEVPATMVHGDFHPDHIFVGKNFVTVIDFERFCVGDAARDVGSFIAHALMMARNRGRPLAAAQHEIDAFTEGYFSSVATPRAMATAERVPPYAVLTSLEALYYVASVLKVVDRGRIAIYLECLRQSEQRALQFTAALWGPQTGLTCGERVLGST